MARKRMVDPNIWQSEDFSKLSTLAKLVFIGLFSLADDEGRGRANPTYLKSSLFPYNEDMRSADIEKTLSEISSNMSVVFYECNGSSYYSLLSWNLFQRIDKPTNSQLPAFEENNKDIRILFLEGSPKPPRIVPPKRKEDKGSKNKGKEEKFIPPTLEDIQIYVKEKSLKVDTEYFYNYFTVGNWIDSEGKQVKNWKQKLLTWSKYSKDKQDSLKNEQKKQTKNNYEQRQYNTNELDNLYANKGG